MAKTDFISVYPYSDKSASCQAAVENINVLNFYKKTQGSMTATWMSDDPDGLMRRSGFSNEIG